jgi:hypothetical protein
MKSVMRLDETRKSTLYQCDCGKCNGNRFDIVYSMRHASEIGWRMQKLSQKEVEALGEDAIILCPECVQTIEQSHQPDKEGKDEM